MLRQYGIDIKTAQELLRHANPTITMGIYQQAVSEEKRLAQNRVVAGLIPGGVLQHPRQSTHNRQCAHRAYLVFWRVTDKVEHPAFGKCPPNVTKVRRNVGRGRYT